MTLTPEQETRMLEMVAAGILETIKERVEKAAEELPCFTINRVCGFLDLTPQQVNKILTEFVDFGPRDRRLSIAQVRELVRRRTVKAGGRKR